MRTAWCDLVVCMRVVFFQQDASWCVVFTFAYPAPFQRHHCVCAPVQLFNELNSRRIAGERNVADELLKNPFFLIIMLAQCGGQVVICKGTGVLSWVCDSRTLSKRTPAGWLEANIGVDK